MKVRFLSDESISPERTMHGSRRTSAFLSIAVDLLSLVSLHSSWPYHNFLCLCYFFRVIEGAIGNSHLRFFGIYLGNMEDSVTEFWCSAKLGS
jgi:hypothetical protein